MSVKNRKEPPKSFASRFNVQHLDREGAILFMLGCRSRRMDHHCRVVIAVARNVRNARDLEHSHTCGRKSYYYQ
jgi:hypothetical protein